MALFVGFGLTLSLWLLVGWQMTRRLAAAQVESDALDARYLRAQDALATIRTDVLLASVIVRDALLDLAPRSAQEYRQQIESAYAAIDSSLAVYTPVTGSPAEFERLQRLRREVDAFRQASAEILDTDLRSWRTEARPLLQRFLPSRENAVAVSEETQSINRALYIEQLRLAAVGQSRLQGQIWTGLGLTLAISLVIAWLAVRYATRLERQLIAQHTREEQISTDLHKLSARLVDVQEEEQRRIARELHDEVGQALSAVKLELVVAQRRILRAGIADDLLGEAQAVAEGALRNVRDLSQLLHPSALEDLGLSAALDSYVAAFAMRTGITVDLVDRGPISRLSLSAERAVYRIVQEALTNVARHAQATTVVIRLRAEDDRLVVIVDDDGRGFDSDAAERPGRREGLGLLGIRERAVQLGGDVRIESAAGRGTRVEVTIPLTPVTIEVAS
jgi:signal transduction histidine kinase